MNQPTEKGTTDDKIWNFCPDDFGALTEWCWHKLVVWWNVPRYQTLFCWSVHIHNDKFLHTQCIHWVIWSSNLIKSRIPHARKYFQYLVPSVYSKNKKNLISNSIRSIILLWEAFSFSIHVVGTFSTLDRNFQYICLLYIGFLEMVSHLLSTTITKNERLAVGSVLSFSPFISNTLSIPRIYCVYRIMPVLHN